MIDAILNFFHEMAPTQTGVECGAIVSVVGTVFTYLVGWDDVVEALLVVMVIDYLTGCIAAIVNPNLALDSRKGLKGILKKVSLLCVVALAHELDKATGQPAMQSIVVWFFIGNEGLSIIENAGKAGLPIPSKLRDTLAQLASEKDRSGKQ